MAAIETAEFFLTPNDLAKIAKVSVRTIQRWTDAGKLPVNKDEYGRRLYSIQAVIAAKYLGERSRAS